MIFYFKRKKGTCFGLDRENGICLLETSRSLSAYILIKSYLFVFQSLSFAGYARVTCDMNLKSNPEIHWRTAPA